MSQSTPAVTKAPHASVMHTGAMADWGQYSFSIPNTPITAPGKLFLKEALGLTGCEISLNQLPPGGKVPFWHRHEASEEVYLFLGGEGEFYVDDDMIAVTQGTVIRVAPQARRTWRNTSATEPLYYIVLQTVDGSFSQTTIGDGQIVQLALPWDNE